MPTQHLQRKVRAQANVPDTIDTFVGKLLAGIGFSKQYLLAGSRSYPPIDDDVTFWCATS